MPLRDILMITKGKTTKVFKRSVCSDVPDNVAFSVVWKRRTVDLVCDTPEMRDWWVASLETFRTKFKDDKEYKIV